jgi:hypothetical protein
MINRKSLKEALNNETRAWIKSVVEMGILFYGGFDAWVEHLKKQRERTRYT